MFPVSMGGIGMRRAQILMAPFRRCRQSDYLKIRKLHELTLDDMAELLSMSRFSYIRLEKSAKTENLCLNAMESSYVERLLSYGSI